VLPGHASGPLGSDQLSYILNPPCRDFRAELYRLRITFCFDTRPPSGFANGKDFQNVWQSYKARFRKYVIVHCDLPSFDQNQGKPMQNDNAQIDTLVQKTYPLNPAYPPPHFPSWMGKITRLEWNLRIIKGTIRLNFIVFVRGGGVVFNLGWGRRSGGSPFRFPIGNL